MELGYLDRPPLAVNAQGDTHRAIRGTLQLAGHVSHQEESVIIPVNGTSPVRARLHQSGVTVREGVEP